MSPSPRNQIAAISHRRASARRTVVALRAGFTLVELIFTMSILSFSAAVFGGLMLAISAAWDHSTALEDSRRQAQSTLSRIKWMVQQAGTYRVAGQSTTLGVAVVPSTSGTYQAPATLVVWSGGPNGGMNGLGLQARLPVAAELVVYTPDPSNPARFVEVTFPADATVVDFRSGSFAATVQTLLASKSAQKILLADRLHVTAASSVSQPSLGNVRFELTASPSDSQISGVTVGSQAWNDLPWGQGLVGADRGLRTANVRIELLLDPDPKQPTTDSGYTTAVPFFGSVNRQYVFQP
jgi:prepilin-type N-terminal cleavage/methylation domain-containing protein